MKSIILSTALILGATAPVFADTANAPGIVNATAAQQFVNIALESDNGNTRLFAATSVRGQLDQSNVSVSTSGVSHNRAGVLFAAIDRASDDGSTRLFAGSPRTLFSNTPVNARAAAIFAEIAAQSADDH